MPGHVLSILLCWIYTLELIGKTNIHVIKEPLLFHIINFKTPESPSAAAAADDDVDVMTVTDDSQLAKTIILSQNYICILVFCDLCLCVKHTQDEASWVENK